MDDAHDEEEQCQDEDDLDLMSRIDLDCAVERLRIEFFDLLFLQDWDECNIREGEARVQATEMSWVGRSCREGKVRVTVTMRSWVG